MAYAVLEQGGVIAHFDTFEEAHKYLDDICPGWQLYDYGIIPFDEYEEGDDAGEAI